MIDRYQIASQLGEDVLGAVYLADDTMLQRRVMCRHIEYGDNADAKDSDDSWKKELGKYTGRLGTMQHPNMLTIYDISVEDDGAFVVTQLVEGKLLAERLEQGPLGQVGVYKMASDMLEALHAAHESGIYHGALHTGSIKRVDRASGGHRYMLVDLGLNQLASMVKSEKIKVADPVLMAPELHEEGKEPDEKADLFMLGQLCYTALVGGHPFSEKSSEECLEAYKGDGMPSLDHYVEGLNPNFAAWVMSLIDGDPEKRPVDTGEAMLQLHSIELGVPESNIPGKTEALVEPYVDPMSGHQALVDSASVGVTTATASVEVAADGTDMDTTQAQVISAVEASEKKEKAMMMYLIGGLILVLVIGGIILATRGGDESSTEEAVTEEAVGASEHAVRIEDAVMVNTVEKEQTPVIIDLAGDESLDWIVGNGIPISSSHIKKLDGSYIQNVTTVAAPSGERSMTYNPIRFESEDGILFPRASIFSARGAKPGSGYEVQLRVPMKDTTPITVTLYIVQKHCDIRVEVSNPKDDSKEVKMVPRTEQGVVKVPVEIDSPVAGGFYTINMVTTSGKESERWMIGLSGAVVEKR